MVSMFDRLTRFPHTPGRDRKEERLTEAFAATLRAAPELARTVVTDLFELKRPPEGEATVTPQRRTGLGLQRVDIEIRFGPRPTPILRVWLELKWGAAPDGEQLAEYDQALQAQPGPFQLALITPAPVLAPPPGTPARVRCATWQDVG